MVEVWIAALPVGIWQESRSKKGLCPVGNIGHSDPVPRDLVSCSSTLKSPIWGMTGWVIQDLHALSVAVTLLDPGLERMKLPSLLK